LEAKIRQAKQLLRQNKTLSPSELEAECFPQRKWGTLAASKFILQHLAYIGTAVFHDQEIFGWPSEVENAFRHHIN
jgi:hypothetical protein